MPAPAPVFISYTRDRDPGGQPGVSTRWAVKIQNYLESVGIACWRDDSSMRSGDGLPKEISHAIEGCTVLLVVVTSKTGSSDWVETEISFAKGLGRKVLPVLVEGERLKTDGIGLLLTKLVWFEDFIDSPENHDALKKRLEQLGVVPRKHYSDSTAPSTQRQVEEHWLQDRVNKNTYWANRQDLYVALTASETTVEKYLQSGGMQPQFDLSLLSTDDARPAEPKVEHFDDVLDAFRSLEKRDIPRLALLGEPGAGKTFALQCIALELGKQALADSEQALPLFVPLNDWTRATTTLEDFLRASLGELGPYWRTLRDTNRAVLLLDAMNEIPTGQRATKASQIRDLIGDNRWAGVVVSCREHDFEQSLHLHLNKLCVRPLDPMQIRKYTSAYLGHETGEACFWEIAGGEPLREALDVWLQAGASEQQFWTADDIPREKPDVYSKTTGEQDHLWHSLRNDPRHLIRMARNPFLLFMLVEIYRTQRTLPASRSKLFETFVNNLANKARQQWTTRQEPEIPDNESLKQSLQTIALRLQGNQSAELTDAQTRLERSDCEDLLTDTQLAFALDSSLLVQSGTSIGFQHQLIQETLSAPGLWQAIKAGEYTASQLWPKEIWWQRNGWEVTLDLLGESLDSAEKQQLVKWIADANPDHASVLAEQWGVQPDKPFLAELKGRWLSEITNADQHPHARAAAARSLGRWGLDTRPGVGLTTDGLPDIEWIPITSAPFYYQNEPEPRVRPAFAMSRYLVTNAQYQAFIDDGGYNDDRWWQSMSERFDA
ncbi:MAG: TIR domain-containing protein, partial [Granulosicoccus sp.]